VGSDRVFRAASGRFPCLLAAFLADMPDCQNERSVESPTNASQVPHKYFIT